jgi:hypothetical protein
MAVGAAAAGAKLVLGSALRYCRRHVMVTAEIDSRDDAYRWVSKLSAAAESSVVSAELLFFGFTETVSCRRVANHHLCMCSYACSQLLRVLYRR